MLYTEQKYKRPMLIFIVTSSHAQRVKIDLLLFVDNAIFHGFVIHIRVKTCSCVITQQMSNSARYVSAAYPDAIKAYSALLRHSFHRGQ